MTVIAQQTVTLPEGAIVTVAKCEEQSAKKGAPMKRYTLLSACRGNNAIEMKVDDVAPQMLDLYLKLVIRDIERRRAAIKEKPLLGCGYKPKTLPDFVTAMALNDMFVFEAISPVLESDPLKAPFVKDEEKKPKKKQSKQMPKHKQKENIEKVARKVFNANNPF